MIDAARTRRDSPLSILSAAGARFSSRAPVTRVLAHSQARNLLERISCLRNRIARFRLRDHTVARARRVRLNRSSGPSQVATRPVCPFSGCWEVSIAKQTRMAPSGSDQEDELLHRFDAPFAVTPTARRSGSWHEHRDRPHPLVFSERASDDPRNRQAETALPQIGPTTPDKPVGLR
jgi:hypothetical protein